MIGVRGQVPVVGEASNVVPLLTLRQAWLWLVGMKLWLLLILDLPLELSHSSCPGCLRGKSEALKAGHGSGRLRLT